MFDNKNVLLYPLSMIYGMVTGVRNFLYDAGMLHSESFSVPVICVGNITIGGTGKTPHSEYLVDLLSREFRVAVLSRGYKRKTNDFRIVTPSSQVSESGDESLQIARKFPEILVAVEHNRVKGIKKIMELKPETEVIILDDGYQHRKITPGFSVLLSDFHRPMPEDNLLPFGSLRESVSNMSRADVIIITKTPPGITPIERRLIISRTGKLPFQNIYFTAIKYLEPVAVFENNRKKFNLEWNSYSGNGAILVTGIVNPAPLVGHLKRTFSTLVHLPFADHHDFTEEDVIKISDAWKKLNTPVSYIITTEKDAMKLRNFINIAEEIKSAFYYIPVGIEFLSENKEEFDKLITEYVRKNKGNNRIPA